MVNIQNFESEEKFEGCKLDEIFRRQMELVEKYKEIECMTEVPVNLHTKSGQIMIRDFCWRITEELGEMCGTLRNKKWSKSETPTDIAHYKEEFSDAFHFMIELAILSGFSSDDLFDIYCRKQKVNAFRQRSNY